MAHPRAGERDCRYDAAAASHATGSARGHRAPAGRARPVLPRRARHRHPPPAVAPLGRRGLRRRRRQDRHRPDRRPHRVDRAAGHGRHRLPGLLRRLPAARGHQGRDPAREGPAPRGRQLRGAAGLHAVGQPGWFHRRVRVPRRLPRGQRGPDRRHGLLRGRRVLLVVPSQPRPARVRHGGRHRAGRPGAPLRRAALCGPPLWRSCPRRLTEHAGPPRGRAAGRDPPRCPRRSRR